MWFRHRVRGEAFPVEQRLQVARFLLGSAVVGDDFGVAGVGRLTSEHERRPHRPAEDLVQQCQLQLAVALAAQLRPEVSGPEPAAPYFLPQRFDDPASLIVQRNELQVREDQIEWLDLLAHEIVRPLQLLLVIGFSFETPDHPCSSR